MTPDYEREGIRLYRNDALVVLPTLEAGSVVTDPPYGMGKAEWDSCIPPWLPLVGKSPVACFCGVVGMRDYPQPDWIGAWVRPASTQRCGRLRGFNNWEPILFYNIDSLANDVIVCPNTEHDTGHPTQKPLGLIVRLIERMHEPKIVIDPFMGSATTAIASIRLGCQFVGVEIDKTYFDIAVARIERELNQPRLPGM